jgi:hypothetical protein
MTALPLFAQAGVEGLGTLNGALSIGGVVAVALLSLLPERVGRQPLLSAIFLLYGVSILALAATRDLAIAAAVCWSRSSALGRSTSLSDPSRFFLGSTYNAPAD